MTKEEEEAAKRREREKAMYLSISDCIVEYKTNIENGLSSEEAASRLLKNGKNEIPLL